MTTSGQRPVIWADIDTGRGSGRRRHRALIITVGVVVLLIAVIAIATRERPSTKPAAATDLLAPEIPHSRAGAESTAAKIASAVGSEAMFRPDDRHYLLQVTAVPDQRSRLIQDYDATYGPFTKQLGLDAQGNPPAGATFVSRTMPAGTTIRAYTDSTAEVDVWCSTLFGLTGKNVSKPIPVKTGWLTMTMTLRWTTDGWRLADFEQKDGPEPGAAKFGEVPQL
ncbi:hypothetical protein ABZ027_31820 [Streptomyces sp. NPDC006332]|uniref:hypothetical protein n=1 Tax=Streptomyces sp. NPDC006332 TaxID=3155456 RepID=UPI0033B213AF